MDILVGYLWQNHKPLLQKLCSESVVAACVGEVDHQLEGFVAEGLQCEDDMVDQEISIRLANLVPPGNVVEHRVACSRRACLVEDV